MPETHPPTRTTENEDTPHLEDAREADRRGRRGGGRRPAKRLRDPRAHDVGLSSRATEERGRGVGYAEERRSRDTEHKTGRTDDGSAT